MEYGGKVGGGRWEEIVRAMTIKKKVIKNLKK